MAARNFCAKLFIALLIDRRQINRLTSMRLVCMVQLSGRDKLNFSSVVHVHGDMNRRRISNNAAIYRKRYDMPYMI